MVSGVNKGGFFGSNLEREIHEFVTALSKRKPFIICGDMNIVSADVDAWDGVSIKQQDCFLDWEHRNFNALFRDANLVDSYREL